MRDDAITLPDRRTLAYTEVGATGRGTPTAVYLHGAPTSRLDLVGLDDELADAGVRVISPDRPGYGGSSPHPGRSMVDHVADIVALADRLGIDRFAVVGLSSGGPYAVAAASVLGGRAIATAVIAGVTDFGWDGAWHGYVEDEVQIMRQPDEHAAVRWCEERYGADGLGFLAGDLPPSDAATAAPRGGMIASIVESFRQGVAGYAHDVWLQGKAWSFDLASITVPVRVYHGDVDAVVPLAHGEHTASVVPGATLEVWPGVEHVATVRRVPDVLRTLLA
jgi:pimeloyl-ACP methyl ester carboxylesterase